MQPTTFECRFQAQPTSSLILNWVVHLTLVGSVLDVTFTFTVPSEVSGFGQSARLVSEPILTSLQVPSPFGAGNKLVGWSGVVSLIDVVNAQEVETPLGG